MPIIKNPYPPIPDLGDLNYYTLAFETSPGKDHEPEYVVQVDVETGEKRTQREFVEHIRDCATALSAPVETGGLGIGHRSEEQELIVIFSPNCLDYLVLVHAALLLTIPFGLIPSKPTLSELVDLLKKLQSGRKDVRLRLFVHPLLLRLALQGAKQIGISSEYIYLMGNLDDDKKRPGIMSLIRNARRKQLPRQAVVPAKKSTLAYLMFSSGTSGPPKAVMVSHGNLCFSMVQGIMRAMEDISYDSRTVPNERWLCFLPFYHSFGLHYLILRAPLAQKTMYILPQWDLNKALDAIPKYKIDMLMIVPSIMHQLVHSPAAAKTDLSSLHAIGCGAAYLSPELEERFKRMCGVREKPIGEQGTEVLEGYGLSEATISVMSRPRPGQFGLDFDRRSIGILLPGQQARIVREDGSDADYGEPGELLLKGDNVTLGYWGDEEATRRTFLWGGWLRTGDRFRVDKSGSFFYEDRMKDTLKISGVQVSPAEIEKTILSHPLGLVVDAAVAGVPPSFTSLYPPSSSIASTHNVLSSSSSTPRTPDAGSALARDERIPRAWVVLGATGKSLGPQKSVEELDKWVRERLSRYKWLTGGISIVNEIPKNPTGKVLRRILVDQYIKEKEKSGGKAKL